MIAAYRVPRDVVRVSGPEATPYLQGQLSQEVEGLGVGSTTWSFVLQPTGKVDSWVRVTRVQDEEFLLDVDGGYGDALVARLARFLLRTKAEVQRLDWVCVALRGPGSGVDPSDDGSAASEGAGDDLLRLPAGWPGHQGSDLIGPAVEAPAGASIGTLQEYEAERIQAGVPAMGAELSEKTIPAEVGQWIVDASVDFTKGCFTGQELVARIDSRGGNVPRHLQGLLIDGAEVPPAGASVLVDGKEVGAVTSSAPSGEPEGSVALAYIGRAVDPPAEGVVTWTGDGGTENEVPVTVRSLPLAQPA